MILNVCNKACTREHLHDFRTLRIETLSFSYHDLNLLIALTSFIYFLMALCISWAFAQKTNGI